MHFFKRMDATYSKPYEDSEKSEHAQHITVSFVWLMLLLVYQSGLLTSATPLLFRTSLLISDLDSIMVDASFFNLLDDCLHQISLPEAFLLLFKILHSARYFHQLRKTRLKWSWFSIMHYRALCQFSAFITNFESDKRCIARSSIELLLLKIKTLRLYSKFHVEIRISEYDPGHYLITISYVIMFEHLSHDKLASM